MTFAQMRAIISRAKALAKYEWEVLWGNCADSSVVQKRQVRAIADGLREEGRKDNTENGLVKRFAARICERRYVRSAF
tara:strand:- start:283483 stop:283716 length:234 start_codon:yes stop_codon:yes gene_type:complete